LYNAAVGLAAPASLIMGFSGEGRHPGRFRFGALMAILAAGGLWLL
jgi:hypothetical protein